MTITPATEQDWKTALANHPVHRSEPVGSPYVLGRWHKDRASLKGLSFEARVLAKSLIVRNSPKKFLMVGRPRSGTTLLRRLLNQVDGIHCDGEVLHHSVLSPRGFLNRLASIKTSPTYGAKALSYQLLEVQKLSNLPQFFKWLVADGFTLIHVRRETFSQSLSLSVAQTGLGYHFRSNEVQPNHEVILDPDRFAQQIRHNIAMLDYEDLLFSNLPHLTVQYEMDLKAADCHQPTIDRICKKLNVNSSPVKADLSRAAHKRTVINLDALRAIAASIAEPKT